MNRYNNLKTRLERVERLNVFFESSGEFWKSECAKLKKELKNAIVSNECKRACSSDGQTPSTSASQNEVTREKIKMCCGDKDIDQLKKYMLETEITFEPESKIYSFFDSCTCFAHLYVSEVCPAKLSTISCNVRWDPREVNSEKEFVRDWRGRCIERVAFKPLQNVPVDGLGETGAPLLSCQEAEFHNERSCITGRCLYSNLPFSRVLQETLFFTTDKHLKDFI